MKKFCVISGFLGSGKTTAMMALSRYFTEHHGKAAMISNDLGGPGLADHRLASLGGYTASELTGDCICYQTENLVDRLNQLFDQEHCELVFSDIPGFGVGALDHVYHKLSRNYPEQFPLAPFTVLCEPHRVRMLMENSGGDLEYILHSQLREADLIVLNKCDLVSNDEKETLLRYLQETYPQAEAMGISAVTGEGLEELSQKMIHSTASLQKPDLQYGGTAFQSAIGQFSEYNLQYYAVVCCDTFDGNAYLQELGEEIQRRIQNVKNAEIPHLKLLAWTPEGDYGKYDLLGIGRPIVAAKQFQSPCRDLAAVLNTSAVCSDQQLDEIITRTVEEISEKYNLSLIIYKKECFSAMGES